MKTHAVSGTTFRQWQHGATLLRYYEGQGGATRLPPAMRQRYRAAAEVVRQYGDVFAGRAQVGFLPFILAAAVLALVGYSTYFVVKTGEELRPQIVESVGEATRVVAQGTAWVSVAALAGMGILVLNNWNRKR